MTDILGTPYGSGEGSLFVQPDGPNTIPRFLGCHDLGDLSEPLGDATLWHCKDPNLPNSWRTARVVRAAPGLVTTTITADVLSVADYLESLEDGTPIYIKLSKTLKKVDIFNDYDRMFAGAFMVTNRNRTNLAMGRSESNDRAEQVFDLTAGPPVQSFFDLTTGALRVSVAETEDLVNVAFVDSKGRDGFAVATAGTGVEANVLDSQADWAPTADEPFAADDDLVGALIIPVDRETDRWITGRATSAVAAPAQIAYSTDRGATWATANLNAVNASVLSGPNALFAFDSSTVWAATDNGQLSKSENGGLDWEVKENANITTDALFAVAFRNQLEGMAVGESDVVAFTSDGGETWSAVSPTGSTADLVSLAVTPEFWWVGAAGGEVYYSGDNGQTWTQRGFDGDGTGTVAKVKFASSYFGVIGHVTGAGVGRLHVTVNGGYTWREIPLPLNTGISDIWIVSTRIIYVAGPAQGGTGYLVKVER